MMSTKSQRRAAAGKRTPSPVGEPLTQGSRRRAARSAAYQAERARLVPFEDIARQVILRRGQLGLTQQNLAERVGTSHSAISRLEGGQHRVSIDTLERVGAALGLRLVVSFEEVETSAPRGSLSLA
jgi:ribosome-binding protein aMBF1 (putative translation factor)